MQRMQQRQHGTKRVRYLEENVGALSVTLGRDDVARVDEVAPQGAGAGTRYPEAGMCTVGR
jgi:hypothetical protein